MNFDCVCVLFNLIKFFSFCIYTLSSVYTCKYIKNRFGLVEKLSNFFQKMSRNGSLNPQKIASAEEKYETGTGDMVRRRSLPTL